jgi:hypothetical protein
MMSKIVNSYNIVPGANLQKANLWGANLQGADLRGADLREANLREANLQGANLRGANLRGANLWEADLQGANLRGANLRGANLRGANLLEANLQGADLREANLWGATNVPDYVLNTTNIVPEGELIVYKKCEDNIIVKLLIPIDSKRSNATGRKCRFSKAIVLELSSGTQAVSTHNNEFIYKVGETLEVKDFDEDRWNECSTGIHAFLTRWEAENY